MFKKVFELLSEKNRTKLIFYFVLSLLFVGIETSLIVIIYPIIDVFLGSTTLAENKVFLFFKNYLSIENIDGLILFSIIFLVIRLIYFLFYNWIKYSYLNKIQRDLALKIFNCFHYRNYLKILKSSSAAFIRDISSETTAFKKFCDTCINLALEILISFFICIFLFYINSLVFTYLVIFLISFALIYFLIVLKILRFLGKRRVTANKKIIKIVSESYKFFELIKLNKVINFFKNDLNKEFQELMNLNRSAQMINLIPRLFIETMLFLGFMMIFLIQIKNIGFEINISTAGIFLVSFLRLFPSVSKIISSIQDLNLFKFSVENIYEQIDESNKNKSYQNLQKTNIDFQKDIEIRNLQLSYESKKIFKNFQITIQKNTFNAIIGKSGSGKTSLIKIFMGLLEPEYLDFMTDGKKIDVYQNEMWQKKIGYASQHSIILNQSLKRNISLSSEDKVNYQKLEDAFKNSGLNIFLNFNKNLEDEMNESGTNFSGGQLQRICLARALYFSEGILILDEICSSLDIESERKIILTLKELSTQYTIIYITHRNNFYEYFDKIINLK